jgi:hypothetical protein
VVSQIYSDAIVVYPAPLIENSSGTKYNQSIKFHSMLNKEMAGKISQGWRGNSYHGTQMGRE